MTTDALGGLKLPLWQRPAAVVAKWHRGIEPFLATDRRVLARLKVSEVAVIVTLLVVTVVPSFFHAIAGFGSTGNYSVFDITLETVYTESIPFMALALLIGLLAPTAGAGFVASFAVIDLIASAIAQQELTPFSPHSWPDCFLIGCCGSWRWRFRFSSVPRWSPSTDRSRDIGCWLWSSPAAPD